MNGIIEHDGVVVDIVGSRVDVKMVANSGCAGCAAQSACGMGDSKDKLVTVLTELSSEYSIGENVSVWVEQAMGIKAVLYAYVFPFLLLLTSLLVLLECGSGETVGGLVSLGLVGVYYFCLYLLRGKIEKEIIFKLRKI